MSPTCHGGLTEKRYNDCTQHSCSLDYVAQVYGASKSNVLKHLEPNQNACLRAITGSFRSSPAVSLCVEMGMLPLDFSRDMLTLEHFFKIQSLPNSPTHRAVIGSLGDPTPRMEHINELCTQYQVQTPKILTNVVPEIPSWTYPPIRNCPFLETKKQGLLDEEMRAIFVAHLERHPTVHIYTDGSKSTEGVGFAAVFPNTTSGGRLAGEFSIFTAELYAINAAVYEILKGTTDGNRFTIFLTRSALLALRSDSSFSPIVVETKELIRRAEEGNIIIDLCWVPGHVNVRGNKKADAAAKDAALRAQTAPHKAIPHTDMRRPLREAITNRWHREWNSLARGGRKLREIKKYVKDWTSSHNKSRRIETVLARLRLGHTNITHVYLMQGQTEPPECDRCRVTITVKRLLLECRKYVTNTSVTLLYRICSQKAMTSL